MTRWTLILLWIGTAWVSWLGWGTISHELVRQSGWVPESWISLAVAGGIALDVLMGLWLVIFPSATTYRAQVCVTILLTTLATAMAPEAWAHPFGPLLKNLPIIALMWKRTGWPHQEEQS